jgi:glycosyltransferase involved in cell wall biosynthesis
MPSIAVCIATYERPALLRRTLAALADQTRPPDELIVADASRVSQADALLADLRRRLLRTRVITLEARTRALPELRWLAFGQTASDIVLFLDDDVQLTDTALATLERAYAQGPQGSQRPAAVGFTMWFVDGSCPTRHRTSWRERWLGMAAYEAGRTTDGGLTVSHAGLPTSGMALVDHLWGGAMSYQRDVLLQVGRLDGLISLYRRGIGRGEDAVLSRCAASFGPLVLLLEPLALHPRESSSKLTPYAHTGWRLGLTATWGRAHTLRWIARERGAFRRDWARLAGLELARAGVAIARRPWALDGWQRFAGAVAGIITAAVWWRRIPKDPRGSSAVHASPPRAAAVQPVEAPR